MADIEVKKMNLLEIENLAVEFNTGGKPIQAVKRVSFNLEQGEIFALVGKAARENR